jgi:hypothetical protein
MLKVPCEFKTDLEYFKEWHGKGCSACIVSTQFIPEDKVISKFEGQFPQNWTESSITALIFKDSVIPRIPTGLIVHFNNMTRLAMNNCQLKEICKEDLRGMTNLYTLRLSNNHLEFLPGDLFAYTPNLCGFDVGNNKIKFIEKGLLDRFETFNWANFKNNIGINLEHQSGNFVEFKKCLNLACIEMKETAYYKINNDIEKLRAENEKLYAMTQKLEKGISDDINVMLQKDDGKDFTIKVDETDFEVHKFLMFARSPTFAEMIKNNPDADKLILKDIPQKTFKEILNFIYTDKEPKQDVDMKEIFGAASKLKIKMLKEIASKRLIAGVNAKNAYDFLVFAHKHNHEELKLKSFGEIKKVHPNLKDAMMNDPEKLKVLIEAWRVIEGNNS